MRLWRAVGLEISIPGLPRALSVQPRSLLRAPFSELLYGTRHHLQSCCFILQLLLTGALIPNISFHDGQGHHQVLRASVVRLLSD